MIQVLAILSTTISPSGESSSFYLDCQEYIMSILDLTLDPSGVYPQNLQPLVELDGDSPGIGACPWMVGKVSQTIAASGGWECSTGTRMVQSDQGIVCG